MISSHFVLFRKTRELEAKIATFLLNIIQAGFLFSRAYERYFSSGVSDDFLSLKNQVSALEAENDTLRREVESQLYSQMLLPDMRSDILKIVEGCDKIINKYESDLILLAIEHPKIPKALETDVTQMIKTSADCVSALISAVKNFFAGVDVNELIQQVYLLEHQVDIQAIDLKQAVFSDKKQPLARQTQLKYFIYNIEKLSDMAEDTADVLSVIAVKHTV